MIMERLLSKTFKTLKPHHSISNSIHLPSPKPPKSAQTPSRVSLPPSESAHKPSSSTSPSISRSSSRNSWLAYLILSTNPPIKTYVGVTSNFSRRLKQHNGELKGGAKATRAGRPWICACLVQGFRNKSKACEFESKWKSISRKLPRKKSSKNESQADNAQLLLLQHRHSALNRVRDWIDLSHLEIHWHLDPV